jgi:glucose/arabinose dehydrogenase
MWIVRLTSLAVLFLLAASCNDDGGGAGPAGPTSYGVEPAFPALSFALPVDLQNAGDGSGRLFVVEQAGRILVFENADTAQAARVFLDIRSQVNNVGIEEGLLGLAFHPDFASNGHYFVYYCIGGPRRTRVSRFTANPQSPDTTGVGTQSDVITIGQPYSNHNGGQIAFGPDGYLYIALGDGGGSNDPGNNGQDRTSLLGSILRIDVDTPPYAIPPDNPFVGNQDGFREEIFAYGLRNPWRFSFDPSTGWLWCGDVGQGKWEEIDLIRWGKNYGWKIMEAGHCRPPTTGCDTTGLEPPIWEYEHTSGRRSITGGYVYRGSRLPGLGGAYIYADYVSGEIWALRHLPPHPPSNVLLADGDFAISSFGVDESGELFICAFDGKIYRLVPN